MEADSTLWEDSVRFREPLSPVQNKIKFMSILAQSNVEVHTSLVQKENQPIVICAPNRVCPKVELGKLLNELWSKASFLPVWEFQPFAPGNQRECVCDVFPDSLLIH